MPVESAFEKLKELGAGVHGNDPEIESMTYKLLTVHREKHVATVTFNRPKELNTLNLELMEEIEHVASSFLHDEETRVVIFKGNGKYFCAGADLKQKQTGEPSLLLQRRQYGFGARLIQKIFEINQVTIASIHGAALGGGACIAAACDFRIGSDDCYCGYPEVKLGMNLMWRSLPLCVRLIGPAKAKRMLMLGQNEDAETLLRWGFLDQVVPRSELNDATMSLAKQYAAQPPIGVQMIKQSINTISSALDSTIMHMDTDQHLLTRLTEDHKEGIRAFFEKRTGVFTGK